MKSALINNIHVVVKVLKCILIYINLIKIPILEIFLFSITATNLYPNQNFCVGWFSAQLRGIRIKTKLGHLRKELSKSQTLFFGTICTNTKI